jgi:hypothetical protein
MQQQATSSLLFQLVFGMNLLDRFQLGISPGGAIPIPSRSDIMTRDSGD